MNGWEYFLLGNEVVFLGLGSFYDIKRREIPIWLLGFFGMEGITCNLAGRLQSQKELLIGLTIGILFLALGWVTRWAIGPADVIGFMILNTFSGWQGAVRLMFIALILSGIYGMYKVFVCDSSVREEMPFFPFLLLALLGGG